MSHSRPTGPSGLSAEFAEIAHLVHRQTGLVFPPNRTVIVQAGIRRAMRAAGFTDAGAYGTALQQSTNHVALMDDLFAELTVGETYFFRDPGQIDVLRREVLPELREHVRVPNGIRVWSAGCATGEEPYTLAMVLAEEQFAHHAYVIGTDLSRERLHIAQRAHYRQWSMRGVSDDIMQRYFTRKRDHFVLTPVIRDMVEFRYLNLGLDQYPSPALGVWGMDVIFCRNVLIYFDEATVAEVARKLLASLSLHGWLFLGASDPMLSDLVDCDVVMTSAGLAYRRRRVEGRRESFRQTHEFPRMTVHDIPTVLPPVETPVIQWPMDDIEHTPEPRAMASEDLNDVSHDVHSASPREFDPIRALDTLYTARDYDAVVQEGEALVRSRPQEELPWVVLVRALANLGRLEDAERRCAAALDQHGTSAELWYLHAILLAEAGRHPESAQAARRAIYLDRQLAVAHLALGTALRKTGDISGARLAFGNALRILEQATPGSIVPASDGETSERIAMAARVQWQLAGEVA